MMKVKYILSPLLFLNLLLACGNSSLFPTLSVPSGKPNDSLAYLLSLGKDMSQWDTIYFEDNETQETNLDTAKYNETYVVYPTTNRVLHFRLHDGAWVEAGLKQKADTALKVLPYLSFTDVENKSYNSIQLTKGKVVCYVFSNHKGEVISKESRERLRKAYAKDSVQFVYLYLTPSDSLVKVWTRRDSLKGVFIGDSLNSVSSLRKTLGIGRSAKAHAFVVDSTQKILKTL